MNRLELQGIRKHFGSVEALRGADFSLARGEVHALLGENGAGKSTLMHVAFGMLRPDAGVIRVDGREVALRSPRDAKRLGIGMVHQHFASIGSMTVGENVELANRRSGEWANRGFGQGLDPGQMVEELPVALRQRLEVVMALATGADVLLLDEPSAVLAPAEVEELLRLVREFVAGGGSAVLITHKLPEVLAAADRVTVLRQGMVTLHGPVAGQTERSLAEGMIGEERGAEVRRYGGAEVPRYGGSEVPRFRGAEGKPGREVALLGGVPVYFGQVTGVAAVAGNGERELLRALAGRPEAAFIPEDRTTEGLVPTLSLTENFVLGLPDDARWARGLRILWPAAHRRTAELLSEFDIRAPGPDALAGTLSGGNQQKLVLARALERRPAVLVAEDPTRGLDIRATAEVHERLRRAAGAGVAVVVHCSDLDEVLELADRMLVVWRGRVIPVPEGAGRARIGELMLGVGVPA